MRYKVPQDVQQADRIVGPLTAVQLVECVVGGSVAYFFYTRTAVPVNFILGFIAVIVTVVFVFVRIQEMSFAKYLLAMTLFLFRPRVRTWKKLSDTIQPTLPQLQPRAAVTVVDTGPAVEPASIRELTKMLDAHHGVVDLEDDDDELLVPDLATGRANTIQRIRELDEKLRARQGRPEETSAPHA